MKYYAYMLRSDSSGRHYYGSTFDLEERVKSHNSTQNKSTRGRGPWEVLGYKECGSRSEAEQTERKLKKMKNPGRALDWLRKISEVRQNVYRTASSELLFYPSF